MVGQNLLARVVFKLTGAYHKAFEVAVGDKWSCRGLVPLLPAAEMVSSALSQHVFPHDNVQHRSCHQPLELAVIVLKLLEAPCIRHVHPAIFGLQLVKTHRADTALAANLCYSQPDFRLLDQPNNLRLGETARSRASAPLG